MSSEMEVGILQAEYPRFPVGLKMVEVHADSNLCVKDGIASLSLHDALPICPCRLSLLYSIQYLGRFRKYILRKIGTFLEDVYKRQTQSRSALLWKP